MYKKLLKLAGSRRSDCSLSKMPPSLRNIFKRRRMKIRSIMHHPVGVIDEKRTNNKCSMCNSDYIQTTFFYRWRFLKKLADDQCSSITKGSIYHINIKYMSMQTFTMGVDWLEIGCLIMGLIFAHTAFLFCTAEGYHSHIL